ncbi:hypothetical protein [Tetrasphaera phage TJE1]|uniref:Uncharacterized protein n=1 Tax=Tetrasphaera phage TJE1 TaxID=981335 RepID=G4W971_9CAUD|nr:hypothetical protein G185_gp39 [Tetrasphaera phage TJE1]ADX42559.1 hypothetical protein [Tetrasphaera phage TJE1]
MSDLANPLNIFDFFGVSELQAFRSIISDAFFADWGIVKKVNGQTSVDVEHAVLSVTRPGVVAPSRVLDALVTTDVELLWMSMSGLAVSGTVKEGDLVMLIGFRDLLPSTQGVTAPAQPPEFWHYTQQTLKAIPFSGTLDRDVQFGEAGGKAFLRNRSGSLFTFLNNLTTHLNTFANSSSTATTAPQIAAAAAILVTNLGNDLTYLSQLLEE